MPEGTTLLIIVHMYGSRTITTLHVITLVP